MVKDYLFRYTNTQDERNIYKPVTLLEHSIQFARSVFLFKSVFFPEYTHFIHWVHNDQ